MLRFLLWAILAFTIVRLVSRFLAPRRPVERPPATDRETGVLVQDKVCGAFVDRSTAVQARDRSGETQYFCSDRCRRKAELT